jgi:excisionase family DNA binding protein
MDKESAAKFLNVSTRSLQRYTTQGKIAVAYKHGKTGAEADYDESELKRFKEQQESVTYQPAQQIAGERQSLATIPLETLSTKDNQLLTILEALRPSKKATVPIESKLLLKLNEAAALTGLSRQTLRTAIDNKKLKAQISAKAWRIKRADLENFIKNF